MSYYLHHFFDPDFNHFKVKPVFNADGRADRHNLGYVQNVVKGQVVAAIIPLNEAVNPDPRFVISKPVFPKGPNTSISLDNPNHLLTDVNGYIFYLDGLITAKNVLNIRGDLDFHTGNVFFVGNMAIHGDVKAGFKVQANDLLIKGMVEGGVVRARHNLAVQKGVRGGMRSSGVGRCMLDAGGDLRVGHVESSELRARGKLFVDRFCLHSTLFAGSDLMVQGRLQGGACHVHGIAYVHDMLGSKNYTPTNIHLGYNPFTLLELERCNRWIKNFSTRLAHYQTVVAHKTENSLQAARALSACRYKLKMLNKWHGELKELLALDEQRATNSKLVAVGTVFPGVEVSIGNKSFKVQHEMEQVVFERKDDAIQVKPFRK